MESPIRIALKDNPLWGQTIQGTGGNEKYDGWKWLIPPFERLPSTMKISGTKSRPLWRDFIGYIYHPLCAIPLEESIPVFLDNSGVIVELKEKFDKPLFAAFEDIAASAGNKGTLEGYPIQHFPIVPPRFQTTATTRAKYRFINKNLSQARIPLGIPSQDYLISTPQVIPFSQDMATTTDVQLTPMNAADFDVTRLFSQDLEPSGTPLRDTLSTSPTPEGKKRTIGETNTPTSSTTTVPVRTTQNYNRIPAAMNPNPTATSSAPVPTAATSSTTTEPPAKKQRKTAPKKKKDAPATPPPESAPAPAHKSAPVVTTPVATPPAVVSQPPVATQPQVVAPPVAVPIVTPPPPVPAVNPRDVSPVVNTGVPANKANLIHWMRELCSYHKASSISNPLETLSCEIGVPPTPAVKDAFKAFFSIAKAYFPEELGLSKPQNDAILDGLLS